MYRVFTIAIVSLVMAVSTQAQNTSDERATDRGESATTPGRTGARTTPGVDTTTPSPRTTVAERQTPGNQGGGGQLDQQIAVCLLLGNQEEVALAEFAQQRAQNERVKQFAQTMIEQHREAISKIEQASPQVASLNLQLDASQTGVPGQPGAQRNRPQAGAAQGGQSTQVALAQSVKQQCLALTLKELSEKQGAEFDKAYIGQQIGGHIGMLAALKGSQQFASPQLQKVIQAGTQIAEHHLMEAKGIKRELEGSPAARSARAPGQPQQPAGARRPQ